MFKLIPQRELSSGKFIIKSQATSEGSIFLLLFIIPVLGKKPVFKLRFSVTDNDIVSIGYTAFLTETSQTSDTYINTEGRQSIENLLKYWGLINKPMIIYNDTINNPALHFYWPNNRQRQMALHKSSFNDINLKNSTENQQSTISLSFRDSLSNDVFNNIFFKKTFHLAMEVLSNSQCPKNWFTYIGSYEHSPIALLINAYVDFLNKTPAASSITILNLIKEAAIEIGQIGKKRTIQQNTNLYSQL